MSASSKKKLRSEANAAKMTERQQAQQKEAKKLKIYTTLFITALVICLVVAAVSAGIQIVKTTGLREKSTVAVSIGDTELTNAQMNYYFVDAVSDFYNNYGTYAAMFGLDVTKPLDQQVTNEETGDTWADDFLENAKSNALSVHALTTEAAEKGFSLTEEELAAIDQEISAMETAALMNGYPNSDDFVKAMYGYGASVESYKEYVIQNSLARAYRSHYISELTYDDAALEAEAEANPSEYHAYSYNSVFISTTNYQTGGTEDENGTITYSEEEKAAAIAAAEADAKLLAVKENNTVEALDAAIAELEVNASKDSAPISTPYDAVQASSIGATVKEWVTDPARKAGDITMIESSNMVANDDGTETKNISGYYVVLFRDIHDNDYALANVRHILVKYEGGTADSATGTTTYSDEEKAAAKEAAEALLAQWEEGDATEDSFAELAKENSDDTSASNGGLIEDIYPGQMVTNFNDWCFADERKAGDSGIVESEYGYHVMFYSSDSETTYRDHLITEALTEKDTNDWYNALIGKYTVTEKNTEYLSRGLIISNG